MQKKVQWEIGKFIRNNKYDVWGVNIFDYEWKDTGKKQNLKNRVTGMPKDFTVYEIDVNGEKHEFAALEAAPGSWLFYFPPAK